jgi:hypothetical protein
MTAKAKGTLACHDSHSIAQHHSQAPSRLRQSFKTGTSCHLFSCERTSSSADHVTEATGSLFPQTANHVNIVGEDGVIQQANHDEIFASLSARLVASHVTFLAF